MSVLVVGLTHRRAPVELLERFSFTAGDVQKGLHQLTSADHVREAAILSTCNRIEVYALVTGYHAGVAALRQFFSEFHHVPASEFADLLDADYEGDAVSHLFAVASGIDSMLVGEPQILAQVRDSFRAASEESAAGPVLSALFRHAIRVGRRARAETGIGRSAKTFAGAGAALARATLGTLDGVTVLVVGAGKMSDVAARRVAAEGASVLVANRTRARARALARRIGGEEVPMTSLTDGLARADLVISSTTSADAVVTRDMVVEAMRGRPERPMALLDLAVPRDVDPAVEDVPGVVVHDLDDLREAVAPGPEQLAEMERVRAIIAEEVPVFLRWQRTHHLAPLLRALQDRGEEARAAQLRRAASRLANLDPDERDAVESLTRSIVASVLRAPVTAVKASAGTAEGEQLARALRALFDLADGTE